MSEQDKPAPATKPVAAAKPPKKLVPRVAPGGAKEAVTKISATGSEVAPVAGKAASPDKVSRVSTAVAEQRKVLAEVLLEAQAINYEQAVGVGAAKTKKAAKLEKPVKAKKPKLVRDSYAMPENEYARIGELKKRLAGMGSEVKKSELLRAGVAVLAALNDEELKAVLGRVERIKTGRPAK